MVKSKNYAGFSYIRGEYNNVVVNPLFPRFPKRFSARAERKRGSIVNGIYPTTEVTLSVKDLSMIDWGLAKLAAFAAKEVVESRNDKDGWNRDFYEDLLRRVDDLQSRLNASMSDLR